MKRAPLPGIIVGHSGSAESATAVDWAAGEAAVRGCPLTVCVVWQYPTEGLAGIGETAVRDAAERIVEEAVGRARQITGQVVPSFEQGLPSEVLLRAAVHADLLVLGRSRTADRMTLGAGSVSARVLAAATSPVAVVPGPSTAERVVVGWDGSAGAMAAVTWAAAEAAVRGVPLTVLRFLEEGRDDFTPDAVPCMRALLAPHLDRAWEVEFKVEVGGAAEGLRAASASASLVVVGARGLGLVRAAELGSVSHALVCRARCPVAVTRASEPLTPGFAHMAVGGVQAPGA